MKPKLETLKPKDARTLALEAAAVGIAAWKLRVKLSKRKADTPAHMIYPIDNGAAFVYPGPDSTIVGLYTTLWNPIEVKVAHKNENSDDELTLEDLTSEDIPTIELLLSSFQDALNGLQGEGHVEEGENPLQTDEE